MGPSRCCRGSKITRGMWQHSLRTRVGSIQLAGDLMVSFAPLARSRKHAAAACFDRRMRGGGLCSLSRARASGAAATSIQSLSAPSISHAALFFLLLFVLCSTVKSGALLNQPAGAAGGVIKFDRKLLTGGCDNQIRLWRLNEDNGQWLPGSSFVNEANGETAHADWVRDASFAPSLGLPSNTIASASEDKSVVIWTEDPASGQWRRAKTLKFDTKVYKLSWSLMGNILAVAQGDNKVSLWKESMEGDWKNLSQAQAAQYAGAGGASSSAPAAAAPGSAPMSPAHQQQLQTPHAHAQQPQHPPTPQQQQQHQQSQMHPAGGHHAQPQHFGGAQDHYAQQQHPQMHAQPPQQQHYGQQPQYGGAIGF